MNSSGAAGAKPGSPAQQERHRRILVATASLASSGGFDAVQMRTVAQQADVALGTLYRYFPSKIHLLVCTLSAKFDEAQQALSQRTIPGSTAQDRLIHVLELNTSMLQREPHLTEALTRAFMFADATVSAEIDTVARHLTLMLTRALRGPAYVEGVQPSPEEQAIAKVIGDVWLASLVAWVTGRASAEDVGTSIRNTVRLLLR